MDTLSNEVRGNRLKNSGNYEIQDDYTEGKKGQKPDN
jgi:hypothetical protein